MTRTTTSPRMDTGPAIVPGWAVLAMGELWLALPQRDVRQFELASDLEAPGASLAQAAGQFMAGNDQSWPVYSLDGLLQLQRAVPEARRICVFYETEDQTRGLLCDRVWSLAEDADLIVEPMPGCMKGPPSPATGLAQFRDHIAIVTNRGALSAYLAYLLEQDYVECED